MDYSILSRLCPWFVAKSAREKKKYRESHKKSQTVKIKDKAYVKPAVEDHTVACQGFVGAGELGLSEDGGTKEEALRADGGGLFLNLGQEQAFY